MFYLYRIHILVKLLQLDVCPSFILFIVISCLLFIRCFSMKFHNLIFKRTTKTASSLPPIWLKNSLHWASRKPKKNID